MNKNYTQRQLQLFRLHESIKMYHESPNSKMIMQKAKQQLDHSIQLKYHNSLINKNYRFPRQEYDKEDQNQQKIGMIQTINLYTNQPINGNQNTMKNINLKTIKIGPDKQNLSQNIRNYKNLENIKQRHKLKLKIYSNKNKTRILKTQMNYRNNKGIQLCQMANSQVYQKFSHKNLKIDRKNKTINQEGTPLSIPLNSNNVGQLKKALKSTQKPQYSPINRNLKTIDMIKKTTINKQNKQPSMKTLKKIISYRQIHKEIAKSAKNKMNLTNINVLEGKLQSPSPQSRFNKKMVKNLSKNNLSLFSIKLNNQKKI